jgi:hypothetical protein
MIFLREKIRVTLLFLGIFCTMWGVVLLNPFREDNTQGDHGFRWGALKDGAVTKQGRQAFAPWIIAIGLASFAGAFLTRERD